MNIFLRSHAWIMGISLLLVCFFVFPVRAEEGDAFASEQKNSLRQSLQLDGGPIEAMAIGHKETTGDNGSLYAGLNAPNGMYWSDDFGTNWHGPAEGADFGTVSDVVASSTPGVAFMIGGINLYRTQDSGQTWEQMEGEDYGQALAMHDTTLIAPMRNGSVSISQDDGETMTNVPVIEEGSIRDATVEADGTVYVLAGDGETMTMYRSNDGQAFTTTNITGDWRYIAAHPDTAGFVVLVGNDGVQYTVDNGSQWTDMDPTNQLGEQKITFGEGNRVYVGMKYTDDFGTSWESVSSESSGPGNFLLEDTVNAHLYTTSDRGVIRSDDDGTSWSDAFSGMHGVTVNDMAQDATKEVVWLAVYGGLAKSENFYSSLSSGGAPTWEYPVALSDGNSSPSGSAIWMESETAQLVIAATGNALWRSEDGGEEWDSMTLPQSLSISTIHTIVEGKNGELYLTFENQNGDVVTGGVLVSTDRGVTWEDLEMPAASVGPAVIDGEGRLLVGVGSEWDTTASKRGVYLYAEGVWTHLSSESSHPLYQQRVNALLYVPETDRLFAAAGETNLGGFFISSDSDDWLEWEQNEQLTDAFWGQGLASEPTGEFVYVSTARPAGTGYLYKCTNDGLECKEFYQGLKDEEFNVLYFDGLVSGSNAGVYSYQAKARLQLQKKNFKKGSAKRKAGRVQLVAQLSDKTTDTALNGRIIKLYRRTKSGTFTFFKKEKQRKGRAFFVVSSVKTYWYKARFVPQSDADIATFVDTVNSQNLRIRKNTTR